MAVHWMNMEIDVQFWSQQVSFVFVGLIVFFTIRGLLIQLMQVCPSPILPF